MKYSQWLSSKGLHSNAATGAQFRLGQGLDPTLAQYKSLGLASPGPPGGDPSQADKIPSTLDVQKAVHAYSQNQQKKMETPGAKLKTGKWGKSADLENPRGPKQSNLMPHTIPGQPGALAPKLPKPGKGKKPSTFVPSAPKVSEHATGQAIDKKKLR